MVEGRTGGERRFVGGDLGYAGEVGWVRTVGRTARSREAAGVDFSAPGVARELIESGQMWRERQEAGELRSVFGDLRAGPCLGIVSARRRERGP